VEPAKTLFSTMTTAGAFWTRNPAFLGLYRATIGLTAEKKTPKVKTRPRTAPPLLRRPAPTRACGETGVTPAQNATHKKLEMLICRT